MTASLRRISGIALKEVRQLRRDTRTLALLIVFPAMMLALYGYALTFDVKHIPLAVLNQDRSRLSHEFVAGFFNSEYFDHVGDLDRIGDADSWLDTRRAAAIIVIPSDFASRLRSGTRADVQILVDGSNANSAGVAVGYAEARIRQFTVSQVTRMMDARGMDMPAVPVSIEPRIWYNPTLETSQFIVPGLIGFLMMLVSAVSTSMSVVREKERNTMEQIIVSAVRPFEFIVGKTLPYLVFGLVTEGLIVVAAMALFGMPFQGSVGLLLLATVVFLLGGLGIGLLISSIAETQQVAIQVTVLATMLPTLVLSDFIFPIASMPTALQIISLILPARHFVMILRSVILKGSGIGAWTAELASLTAFAFVVLSVATARLSARMRRA